MKRIIFPLALAVITWSASAALPLLEPFADRTAGGGTSYSSTSTLATQSDGLGNIWNSLGANFPGTEPRIAAGSLSHTNLPPATGNSASFAPANSMSARLNFNTTVPISTRSYYSYLLKITDLTAVTTFPSNNFFAGFSDGSAGQPQQLARIGTRVVVRKSGVGYVLGTGRNNSPAEYVYDTTVYNVNDVVFVVGSYDVTAGVTNVNVWINPPPSSFGSNAAPPATISAAPAISTAGNLNNNGIAGFVILCQNPAAPSGIIDELRLGTTWTSVTGGDPAILQNPSNQTLPPGANATFTVQARGTPSLSYRWIKDGSTVLSDTGNISGSQTATLTVSTVSPADVGSYSVVVTNGLGGSVQSPGATLAISDPAIIGQPQNRTDNFGATATFQVTPLGTIPFSYQWHKEGFGDLSDGGNISGSHANILTISGVAFPDGGDYSVTVANSLGSVTSVVATLTVNDPVFLSQPLSTTNNEGSNVTFTATADGSGPLTYQWYKNGFPLADGGNVSGATTTALGLNSISLADAAGYNAVATGTFGSVTSSVAFLSVVTPVVITAQPTPRTVPAGSRTILAVGTAGWAPIGYQWQHEGTNVPGATSAAYLLANVQPPLAGNYRVIASNVLGMATSSVAVVAIANTMNFYRTNLAVIRVGDGAQALTANGNSIFLDQFTSNGLYVHTLTIPDTGTNAMITMGPNVVPSPSSVTGTGLSRSADDRTMVIAGYNTAVGYGGTLHTAPSASVPRGIALVNAAGQYSLAVSSTDPTYDATFFRAAVYDGTNNYWGAARISGTYYFGFDDPPAVVQNVFANMRAMALFNGSIYCVGAVSGNNGVLKLSGMPRTSAAANPTLLFPGSTASSDAEVSPDGNLIYVADDRNGPIGGIQRYDFDGVNWNLAYTLTGELPFGARYVTADFHGPNPIVYAITRELTDDNNRIVMIEDTGAASVGTTLAYAGVNQNFRGARFGPSSAADGPPLLSFTTDGPNLILSWSGAFTLQSATNVAGPYGDVTTTSPHTNSFNSAPQLFFRLKQ